VGVLGAGMSVYIPAPADAKNARNPAETIFIEVGERESRVAAQAIARVCIVRGVEGLSSEKLAPCGHFGVSRSWS